MRIIHTLSLLVVSGILCTGSAISQQSGSANSPFTLEITVNHMEGDSLHWDFANTTQKDLKAGSLVEVRVRKANRSDHDLPKSPADGGPYPYKFEIRDNQGNLLEPKVPHGWIKSGGPGLLRGSKDMFLQPGESEESSAQVSNWYDMSKPGIYTIQVLQHISNDPTSAVVQSNVIKIRVLPAE